MQRAALVGFGLVLGLWLAGPTLAQVPGSGMQLRSQIWTGSLTGPRGRADCKIQTLDGLQCKIFVEATGLQPHASYTLWSDANGTMMPMCKDVDPMSADRKGALKKSEVLNSCPTDREVHVILREELGAGRFGQSLDGVLKSP
jgi:hypothetical protein